MFETIYQAERVAIRRLPPSVYKSVLAGSEKGITLSANVSAFDELLLVPRILGPSLRPSTHTTILGQRCDMPIMVAPTGGRAIHPAGQLALSRGARSCGVPMAVSIFSPSPLHDSVQSNPFTHFQLYWIGGRRQMARQLEIASAAGVESIILTLDWSPTKGRDWGTPAIPMGLGPRQIARYLPELARRPRWLWSFARARRLPTLGVPNLWAPPGKSPLTMVEAIAELYKTPLPDWSDVEWLRNEWPGRFTVKGISNVSDACRAVDSGASAVSVSNHGGNMLDGAPASIRLLPDIAAAIGDRVEVLFDGGIRRGSDVVKALALGANAVMAGRAPLWGLAAGGQRGVETTLSILKQGIESALFAMGIGSTAELGRENLVMPAGFALSP